MSEPTPIWILYDERAVLGDTDEATVYSVATSLKAARQDADDMGVRCAIYTADLYKRPDGDVAENERFIEVYPR